MEGSEARSRKQEEKDTMSEPTQGMCRNGAPHYCPNCDNTFVDLTEENTRLREDLDRALLEHQETRGTVAAWKQKYEALDLRRRQLETANGEIAEEIQAQSDRAEQAEAENTRLRQVRQNLRDALGSPDLSTREAGIVSAILGQLDAALSPDPKEPQ